MDMTGEQRIPAPQKTVWRALNDPEILRACIPGCQELVKLSDTEMTAIAVVKVGPISARFQGAVTLSDLEPPHGYSITGEGQGGVAGHAKGGAIVRLAAEGDETILTYEVSAQIGGKLAQLGGRMIDATAKSMSTAFFKKFAAEIEQRDSGQAPATAPLPVNGQAPAAAISPARSMPTETALLAAPHHATGQSRWLWMFLGILLGTAGTLSLSWGLPSSTDTRSLIGIILVATVAFLLGRQHFSDRERRTTLDRQTLDLLARYFHDTSASSRKSD